MTGGVYVDNHLPCPCDYHAHGRRLKLKCEEKKEKKKKEGNYNYQDTKQDRNTVTGTTLAVMPNSRPPPHGGYLERIGG